MFQEAWLFGLEWMMNFVSGRARGVALKSNRPLRKAFADSFGLYFYALSIFNVINAW